MDAFVPGLKPSKVVGDRKTLPGKGNRHRVKVRALVFKRPSANIAPTPAAAVEPTAAAPAPAVEPTAAPSATTAEPLDAKPAEPMVAAIAATEEM